MFTVLCRIFVIGQIFGSIFLLNIRFRPNKKIRFRSITTQKTCECPCVAENGMQGVESAESFLTDRRYPEKQHYMYSKALLIEGLTQVDE
jgi:hypothetical protein